MRRGTEKKGAPAISVVRLQAEVKRLRRDVDLLGMQRTLDELLMRVSRLETVQGLTS